MAALSLSMADGGVVLGLLLRTTARCADAILAQTMDAEDAAAIQAVLAGETERYAELVDRYQQPAIRLAFSLLGNAEDARDASQEAFVSAFRSLGKFRGKSKFSTWLYRIIVNKCHDMGRVRARMPKTVSAAGPSDSDEDQLFCIDSEDSGSDPRARLSNRELARELGKAVQSLSAKQREAFALHHLQGLSLDEAAAVMGCRAGTVKSHVFRATESLRVALASWR